jgi:hypothetical protein
MIAPNYQYGNQSNGSMASRFGKVIREVVSNTPQIINAGMKASQGDLSGFRNFAVDPTSMDAVNLEYIASVFHPPEHHAR